VTTMLRRARAAVLGAVLVAGRAAAQNADGVLLGAEASLTGGAVLATTRDAVGAYYNPAGLGAMTASSLQVSGSAYQLSSIRLRSFVRTTLPWTSIDQSVSSTDWSTAVSVAAYGFRLSPRLGLALGLWVPAGGAISLVSTLHSSGPFTAGGSTFQADYTQRIALVQRIERTYLGAAAGYALRPGLRVGASAFLVYEKEEDFFDVFAGVLTSSPNPAQEGATASASIRGTPSEIAARLGAGVQWELSPALTVAAALKTPSLALVSMGEITTVTQLASLLPGADPSVGFSQQLSSQPGIAEPWRLALGAALAAAGTSLRAELDWQAPRAGQRGVLNGRLGLRRAVGGDLAWGAGVFTDRSREDARSGALAVDYYGVAVGVDYRLSPVRAVRPAGAAWDVRAYLAVRYALGVGEVERLQANPFDSTSAPSSTARVLAHALSVNAGGILEF
jgi:hypothetical protein